jgi:hypothetical protein
MEGMTPGDTERSELKTVTQKPDIYGQLAEMMEN